MKTFEWIIRTKKYKNDSWDWFPLTVDILNKKELKIKLKTIKLSLLESGDYSDVKFDNITERK